jgi:hypothetical protein
MALLVRMVCIAMVMIPAVVVPAHTQEIPVHLTCAMKALIPVEVNAP